MMTNMLFEGTVKNLFMNLLPCSKDILLKIMVAIDL